MLLNIPGRLEDTQVANFGEASALYSRLRDESGEGASTFPDGQALGVRTYKVSYNGKIWDGDEVVYNPYAVAA